MVRELQLAGSIFHRDIPLRRYIAKGYQSYVIALYVLYSRFMHHTALSLCFMFHDPLFHPILILKQATGSLGEDLHTPSISILDTSFSRTYLCHSFLPILQPPGSLNHAISVICS